MKKLLAAVVLLTGVAYAAAPTYTATGTRSVKGVCGTGTCTDAPSGATAGAELSGTDQVSVFVEADSGQTLSGAGSLLCYVYNDVSTVWARTSDCDLVVTASSVRGQGFLPMRTAPRGRVTWLPSGVTISSGGVTVYINLVEPSSLTGRGQGL